jgi:Cu+-exporting ATPase
LPAKVTFAVSGLNCANCARRVSEAASAVTGVTEAIVHLAESRLEVRWNPGAASPIQAVQEAVARAGYGIRPISTEAEAAPSPPPASVGWWFNVVFGGALTLPMMLGEWVFGWGLRPGFQWMSFALALPVLVVCGARFYRGAWAQLRRGQSNMDTLVALGATTAFVYSAALLLTGSPHHLYFMESAAIILLISVGHWLEAIASERASGAVRALLDLAPQRTKRLDADGQEQEVPVAELRLGDRVALRPGDRVPTDGVVREGQSVLDESMMTGESMPVDKAPGSCLYGGTINQSGRLIMEVSALGESTALAQIVAVVRRAQQSRASIQRLADRVSSIFVPAVILVALATAAWWGWGPASARAAHGWLADWLWPVALPSTALAAAVVHAAAVLIVACPCAMGLATPAAIMAGTNVAARRGILIRDGVALEKSGRITTVVFDKTGTLTEGILAVAQTWSRSDAQERTGDWREWALALAQPSNHPLSQAVVRFCQQEAASFVTPAAPHPGLSDWREHRGEGVAAALDATAGTGPRMRLRLGSLRWLRQAGVNLQPADDFARAWAQRGATVIGLALGGELLAVLALRDQLKSHGAEVVKQLRQSGQSVYLLTGDSIETAQAIALEAGIAPDKVLAEVRPTGKAEALAQLQALGQRVAFVGDGINDAPALQQADLGIAVSRASDVAREAADIILLQAGLQAVPEALGLARATLRTIHQNLFWAFFYNAAAIPLAALGFLSPVICAAAMGLSDVLVIGNALRLRRWRMPVTIFIRNPNRLKSARQ